MSDGFGISIPGYGGFNFSGGGGVSSRKYAKQMRKSYEYQNRYGIPLLDRQYQIQDKYARSFRQTAVQDTVADAQKAGIHPLLAMGGGGSSMGSPASMPYQPQPTRESGSTVSLKTASPAEAAAVKESAARTKLLEAQADQVNWNIIENNAARARQATNASQDIPQQREPVDRYAHKSEAKGGTAITHGGKTYKIPPGTPAREIEDEIGEWADWTPDTITRALEVWGRQWRAKGGPTLSEYLGKNWKFYGLRKKVKKSKVAPKTRDYSHSIRW